MLSLPLCNRYAFSPLVDEESEEEEEKEPMMNEAFGQAPALCPVIPFYLLPPAVSVFFTYLCFGAFPLKHHY